ncbi:MAG TPA: hypothetical protein V6D48_02270 [Oculatellaceae cyanobacterium]
MIFQSDIENIDSQISQLLAQVEAKKQRQTELLKLDALTDSTLGQLGDVVSKIGHYAPDAIATLKSAVLRVFPDDGNNESDGGSQPIKPTPEPDDEPELLCLNGETGEALTTTNLDAEYSTHPHKAELNGQAYEWSSPFASHLACLLWEDAPLTGQTCEWASLFASPFACPIEPMPQPQKSTTEMVHTSARTGYLKLKANGQILSSYAWFPRKDLAEAWFDWLDGMSLGLPELRLSQRNSSWKYEIKLTGLSMTQIERLSQEDLSRKPSKKKETPAQAAGIEPPSGWRQPQQPEVQVTAEAPKKARIILESSPYNGHVCDVVEVSHSWWTLATPKGNLKYPADSVEPVGDAVQMAQNRQEAEAIEFNDIVQVSSDGNDCVGLVGSFGRVKVVKGSRIGVEIDEQLVYFKSSELKLKVKAETPSQQQNHPPSADVSISDQEATYLQTNGNYKGLAKQTRQRWEQAGIDPSALIADMKAKRPAEPAWDAERYNPVFAGVGADDASDF